MEDIEIDYIIDKHRDYTDDKIYQERLKLLKYQAYSKY